MKLIIFSSLYFIIYMLYIFHYFYFVLIFKSISTLDPYGV